MSLEQHSIDQGYHARLANVEVTPPAHAWAAISAQLPADTADKKGTWWWLAGASAAHTPEEKSKRERIIFLWWTAALLAIAALSLFAYYGGMSVTSTPGNPTPSPQPSAATLVPIAATSIQHTNESLSLAFEADEDCPEILTTTTAIAANTSSLREGRTASNTNESTSTPSRYTTTTKVRNIDESITVPQASSKVLLANQNKATPLPTDTQPITPPTTNPIGLSMESAAIDKLPLTNLTLLESEALELPFGPGIACEDFRNRDRWSFAVRAFGGPGTVFQDFKSTAQTAAYENLRDSIENDQISAHGGLRFEAVSDLGLFLRAGADYQMYRNNMKDNGAPRTRTIIDSVFMEDTQTWRVETRNEVFQEQRNVYNRQHALTLTAGVGYRKSFGNISPYIMAEAGYEFVINKRGDFVLPDGNFIDLEDDDDDLYITDRPGFQFGGVIGVDFALTNRIEVGVSGHYKQLGGLRGSADLLDYDQSTAFGALNLRYTLGL